VRAGPWAVLLAGLATVPITVAQERSVDLRALRPPAGNSFEALWVAYAKADAAGDEDAAQKAFAEIRRLRVERNVRSLERVALALVSQGLERLGKGERDKAEAAFRNAAGVDPYLPEAYFGLALSQTQRGPIGFLGAVRHTFMGLQARLPTWRGRHALTMLLVPVGLLTLLATLVVVAVTVLLRHGSLLLHDLEERFGAGRGRNAAVIAYAALVLLPLLALQGYGWLPLWWLVLLSPYLDRAERAVAVLFLALGVALGPTTAVAGRSLAASRNPLLRAAMLSVEGEPDWRATSDLERAAHESAADRDLAYLLAAQYRKAGRYDDAAAVYRELLRSDARDPIALNNLANIEFARGEYQAAVARYKQGVEGGYPAPTVATFYYNLSLTYLQRFDYQPAQEARSQAERLAESLIRSYDGQWKYDKGENAVVDLGLSVDEVWTKFLGRSAGVAVANVAAGGAATTNVAEIGPALLNRFLGFGGLAVVVTLLLSRFRGPKGSTRRCVKCGMPFCKKCQLGTSVVGLCTQCHHLFFVRDGVSGPARNKKLLEVQREDARRERIFRILSLVSPGAGHIYARRTVAGVAFVFAWYGVLVCVGLAGGLFAVTEAPAALARPWGLVLAGVLLLGLYVAANRARPDFEMLVPVRRGPPRRGRPA
jgi:tetratricopeptide (TPR) repeat protein